MEVGTELLLKVILGLVALVVVLWELRPSVRDRPRAGPLLLITALVAGAAYYNFGQLRASGLFVHSWEQFHYVLGSKYFPELGYDGLYVASLQAQKEADPALPRPGAIRDLRTNLVLPTPMLESAGDSVKARFAPERWREFVDDHHRLLALVEPGSLPWIRQDHGYNPSPAWTFVARVGTAWLPVNRASMTALAQIDTVLLALLFVMIARTYGSRVACLALILFGLGSAWRFAWVGGSLLRFDWLVAAVGGICALRRERFGLAGTLFGYAAMVRLFPVMFLFGPAVVALRHWRSGQDLSWAKRLALGLVATVGLGLAAGSLAGRGPAAWAEFAANTSKHEGTWLTNNVGLEIPFLYDIWTDRMELVFQDAWEEGLTWKKQLDETRRLRRFPILTASLFFVLIAAGAAWRRPVDEAAAVAPAVVFALTSITSYYWVMLLVTALGRRKWPFVAILAISTYALQIERSFVLEVVYGRVSWLLAGLFLVWLLPDALRAGRSSALGPELITVEDDEPALAADEPLADGR